MPIVPTGSPAWVRNADHTVYGGHVDKVNWHSQGVVNPRTDVGAEAIARLAADMEALSRVAPFCVLTVLCDDDGTPNNPTVEAVNQMTGVRVVSYAGGTPPTGFPTATRNGNGDVTFVWNSSYDDPYGAAGTLSIEHAEAHAHGTTALRAVAEIVNAFTVRVRVFVSGGTAAVSPRFTLEVT